jgi:hypothetical protein
MKNKEMVQETHRKQYPALERRGKKMIRVNQYTTARRGKHSRKCPPPQALKKDDINKIGYQVKEVMYEAFQHTTQKQEEIHMQVQEKIASLHQLLEVAKIALEKMKEEE